MIRYQEIYINDTAKANVGYTKTDLSGGGYYYTTDNTHFRFYQDALEHEREWLKESITWSPMGGNEND